LPAREQGGTMAATMFMGLLMVGMSTAYMDVSTAALRTSAARVREVAMLNLSEAGLANMTQTLWSDFKRAQRFTSLDSAHGLASPTSPTITLNGVVAGVGNYTSALIGYAQPDSYNRYITVRSVGWVDRNGNGQLDDNEPRRAIDQTFALSLDRSGVFDYAYFVNNYGWMYGFDNEQLIVNGDMRANGDFEFRYGRPVINGSIYACRNDKLIPGAAGTVNLAPRQWSNSNYNTNQNQWMRQAYSSSLHGATNSSTFQQWRDLIYNASGSMVDGRSFGSVLADVNNTRKFDGTVLDTRPTEEMLLPNLNDLNHYLDLSQTWRDTKANYGDGTANPDYNRGAYVEVWDPAQNRYVRLDSNGVVSGSAALVGYKNYPIKIHGPVTFTQDVVVRGYVQGQGTLYSGRNVHVVGDIIYKNSPDFRGTNLTTIDNNNEKKDMLALAARGSVMMGNTKQFARPYPLDYMTPPFTKPRYDDDGNLIPAFNALEVDGAGRMRYKSLLGPDNQSEIERLTLNIDIDQNGTISNDEKGISRVDSVLFTNFVGGGNLATDGLGFTLNGSIICKDEAMVLWSLPMRMNYDARIRERGLNQNPLIDINLPRTPSNYRMAWQSKPYTGGALGIGNGSGM
jgi:hypothetical protein